METNLFSELRSINASMYFTVPELILACGILLVILIGFFTRNKKTLVNALLTLAIITASVAYVILNWHVYARPVLLFNGFIRSDDYSSFFKILIDAGVILTVLMSMRSKETSSDKFNSEYYSLLLAAALGSHLLVMSTNLIMIFLSLELLSISSYVLAGYSFTKKGAEGSLKYFLFGSAASAIMLYGFSILFGITGTLDFSSQLFFDGLLKNQSSLVIVAGFMALAGFLYKIAAAPMHPWAPDVYEAAPIPVVAFLSVVPKLAGIAVISKFIVMLDLFGKSSLNWQLVMSVIAMITIAVGNFSALSQKNPKRMIAYSSIAQAGFLLIGVVCFSVNGIHALLFYSAVYLITNFAVMFCLQAFEKNNILSIPGFSGIGKSAILVSVVLAIGLISLSGIPPTGGFTSKLFLFAALWESYEQTGQNLLLGLLVFGLLNTVVSLFYYLKIPYYSFLKSDAQTPLTENTQFENFLAFILVTGVLFLFIHPDLLMGWVNTINFVL